MTRHQVVLVHSSDLHLGADFNNNRDIPAVRSILQTAHKERADVLLLAGDVFDHNRVPADFVERIGDLLAAARLETIILPGNHDCLAPDSVYRKHGLADLPNMHIIGLTAPESITFPHLDLEVWGRAHLDYDDMSPFTSPPTRAPTRWHVGMGHGHWVRGTQDAHRAYLIPQEHLDELIFDYVALGHWDVWTPVEGAAVPVYYSGSPYHAKSVNVVYLDDRVGVRVERRELEVLTAED
jgi:DNA repair exonuclease SbcCD nuclease subunit